MSPKTPAAAPWSDAELDAALDQLRAKALLDVPSLAEVRNAALLAFDIEVTDLPSRTARRRRRERQHRRALVAVGAMLAVASVVLVAGLVALGSPRGSHLGNPTNGNAGSSYPVFSTPDDNSAALNASAASLVARPLSVPAGKFLHVTVHAWYRTNLNPQVQSPNTDDATETIDQVWIPSNPAGIWFYQRTAGGSTSLSTSAPRGAVGSPASTSPAPPQGQPAACGGFLAPSTADACTLGTWATWGSPTSTWIASLPRDADLLWQRLQHDGAGTKWGDEEAFNLAAEALATGMIPTDLTVALYKALATHLPQLSFATGVANADGAIGNAIGLYDPKVNGTRFELIIDPATGQFLGERDIIAASSPGDLKTGTVTSWTAVNNEITSAKP